MPLPEQTQHFLAECLKYRLALRSGKMLTDGDILLIKTKLYEVICDLDEAQRLGGMPRLRPRTTQAANDEG